MFVYCFSQDLMSRLIKDGHKLIHETANEKGPYWVFELIGYMEFSESDQEGRDYFLSKRMSF